jgi:predicted acetyltransferase
VPLHGIGCGRKSDALKLRLVALSNSVLAYFDSTPLGLRSVGFTFLHPDGYALYRMHGHGPTVARVDDLTATTTDPHVALWRALLGLDLREKVIYGTHPADPLQYLLTDSRVAATTAYQDDLWLRIMDIPTALEARRYQAELGIRWRKSVAQQ